MRAVVLAGGLGTRLHPYTTVLPKPLVPLGDRPILEHIVRQLAAAGVTRVDLCVSHLGELIEAYFSQARTIPEGMEVVFHWEDEPLGTAGALTIVPDLPETFIAMNGDVLTSLDYAALVAFHHEQGAALTIGAHRRAVDVPLGVLDVNGTAVTGFREKPRLHYLASMGVYVYDAAALELLPDGPCQFPDLVLRLLDAGRHVAVYESDALWYDIGTLEEYERAAREFGEQPDAFVR